MPYQHNKINELEGGWYVVFKGGEVITENEMSWIKVPNKNTIKLMGLKWRNKHFELEDKANYIPPGETHVRELAISNGEDVQVTKQSLIGRFIGYYGKDSKVLTRVDVNTGKFITENIHY